MSPTPFLKQIPAIKTACAAVRHFPKNGFLAVEMLGSIAQNKPNG
jgi:hypothetical protein